MKPLIPVSVGELFDKITILQIKQNRIGGEHIGLELGSLICFCPNAQIPMGHALDLLRAVNEKLWNAEDAIRVKEAKREFDDEFVQIARSIYKMNDERAAIKKRINEETNSEIVEVKQYAKY